MKTLALLLCPGLICSTSCAQGLVNFFNNANTLISWSGLPNRPTEPIPGGSPVHYFALLTAPVGTTDPFAFTFAGIYATNMNVAGRINGGNSVSLAGWQPGTERAFMICGWSADGGPVFNPTWMTQPWTRTSLGFGVSQIVPFATAGGNTPSGSLPSLNLFGGTQGLPTGFFVSYMPEPQTTSILGIGAALVLLKKARRKRSGLPR